MTQPTKTLKTYEETQRIFENYKLDLLLDKLLAGQENTSKIYPLRTFQRSLLRIANQKELTFVIAPSQSGKSSAAAAFMLPLLFQENSFGAWYSNNEENAQKIKRLFVNYILGNPKVAKAIYQKDKTYTKAAGIGMPSITKVMRDRDEYLLIENTGTEFLAKAATVGALSGKSPNRLHLDEMAIWSPDKQAAMYNEGLARMGDTHGKILVTSTVHTPGRYEYKGNGSRSLRGNLFYAEWDRIFKNQQNNPNSRAAALSYTYHVSDNLAAKYADFEENMAENYLLKHYWGVPLIDETEALFAEDFKPLQHVKPEKELRQIVDEYETFCFSLDPGNDKAITIGSYSERHRRLIVWGCYTAGKEEPEPQFIGRVWKEANQRFPRAYQWLVTGDIAMHHKHSLSNYTTAQLLMEKTGNLPQVKSQGIDDGVGLIKRYMQTPESIYFCDEETKFLQFCLREKILYGKDKITGELTNKYPKDGVHDHAMDSFRYMCYNVTSIPPGEKDFLENIILPTHLRFR
jgi:hypothetical protein